MFGDSLRQIFEKSKHLAKSKLQKSSGSDPSIDDNEAFEEPTQSGATSSNYPVLPKPGVRADLRHVTWCPEGLVLSGWVTVGGKKRQVPGALELLAKPVDSSGPETADNWLRLKSIDVSTDHLDVNNFVKSGDDLTAATFTVLVPYRAWDTLSTSDLQIVLRFGDLDHLTPFTHRYRWGAAGHLYAQIHLPNRYAPRWDNALGLCISRSQPTAFLSGIPEITDVLRMDVEVAHGFEPAQAQFRLDASGDTAAITLEPVANGVSLTTPIASLPNERGVWGIILIDRSGNRRLLHWSDDTRERFSLTSEAFLEQRPGGALRLVRGDSPVIAKQVKFSLGKFTVDLAEDNAGAVDTLVMRGPRATVQAQAESTATFVFNLGLNFWGQSAPVPPAGGYRLFARGLDGVEVPLRPSRELSAMTPIVERTSLATFRTEHSPDNQLYLDISAPLSASTKGLFNRRRLAGLYTGRQAPAKSEQPAGVFLESWYGKTFSDNPAPMLAALRDADVPGPYHVAIADWSVSYPEEAHPVIVGSEEYWKAMGSSRLLIFNTWLPSEFRKGDGQYIVQTWHGTPLKSLGMDVPRRIGSKSASKNLRNGSAAWDLLVSQSSYATTIFRRAYVFDGEIAEIGYPRNDLLAYPERDGLREIIRDRLGLPQDAKVVLYAPTWRETNKGAVGPLDVSTLLDLLPAHYYVAVRGHSVTLRRGSNLAGDRMIDVTSYPEPAELLVMSDALVTDYSSIMFDYAASDKPILFFTPDYEDYIDLGRGAYFDLKHTAPGPLTTTPEQLAKALLASPLKDESAEYLAWQEKFVPCDDGHVAERLARLIAARLADHTD